MSDDGPRGRTIGIDLGGRRTGVAISDGTGRIALPLLTLSAERKDSDRIRRLCRLADQHEARSFVVGLPLRMDGSEGPEALAARAFAERLAERSGRPVALVDERLTTRAAERSLQVTRTRGARRKEVLDQMAAALILQSWLDRAP